MIDKFILLVGVPFTDRDYARFGIDRLLARGLHVEVWDVCDAIHSTVAGDIEVPDRTKWLGYKRFSTRETVIRAIHGLTRTTMVTCLIRYSRETLILFRAISSAAIPYAVMVVNILPAPALSREDQPIGGLLSFVRKIRATSLSAGISFLYSRFLIWVPWCFGVRPAALCILGGSRCAEMIHYPVGRGTRYLWTHAFDYDTFIQLRDEPVPPQNPSMGVFLDDYLPFHPDYILIGDIPPCGAEEYYPELCRFFDHLELRYDVHITVAAHPKSQYGNYPNYFGGRPVIRSETAALVRKAGFVILRASTSVNFAVLFEKPVIFVTNHRINANPGPCRDGAILNRMAAILGKNPVFLDKPLVIDWTGVFSVDPVAYAEYRDAYIKKQGTDDRNTWEIVADALQAW